MMGTSVSVTIGMAVLTKSPTLTGAIGLMMIPGAIGGAYDFGHGFLLMYEAFGDSENQDKEGKCK